MKNSVELWRSQTAIARKQALEPPSRSRPPPAGLQMCRPGWRRSCLVWTMSGWRLSGHIALLHGDCGPSGCRGRPEGVELLGMHTSDGIRSCAQDRHLPPGEGDTDWPRLFAALKDIGFAGAVVMEVKSPYLGAALLRAIGEFLKRAEGGGA